MRFLSLFALAFTSPLVAQDYSDPGKLPANVYRVPVSERAELSSAEKSLIEASVKKVLIDPTTPLFELGPQIPASNLYCGLVNGRNRFGGYTGLKTFAVVVERNDAGKIISANGATIVSTSSELSMKATLQCIKDGYPAQM